MNEVKVFYGLLNMSAAKSVDTYLKERRIHADQAGKIRHAMWDKIYKIFGDVDMGGLTKDPEGTE